MRDRDARPVVTIRPAESRSDWLAARELCCATAASGAPIERDRWPFFGELWIGPYELLTPGLAFVAEVDGRVRGYLTGCAHTRAFVWRRRVRFVPRLMARVFRGEFERNADVSRFLRRSLRLENAPEREFPRALRPKLDRDFPAHLHINIDAACRGLGVGRLLIERFLEELRVQGVPGLHVFCGAAPVAFYEAVGFRELARIDFTPRGAQTPVPVFCLARATVDQSQ